MVRMNQGEAKRRKREYLTPSVTQINADKVTQLSHKYWASYNVEEHEPYDPAIIDDLYFNELRMSKFQTRRIALLEISQYLENYLWPNFDPEKASFAHVMSIVCMINEKSREGVPIWNTFSNDEVKFEKLFRRILTIILDEENIAYAERFVGVTFLNTAFSSLEVELVRKRVQNLVSLHIWHCLSEGRREREFKRFPKWKKYWRALIKREEKDPPEKREEMAFYRTFFRALISNFLNLLQNYDYNQEALDKEFLHYCEKFIELMIDLQALLPTRRYLNILLDDLHLLVRCQMSTLAKEHGDGVLFSQLLERLKFYAHFEISNETGDPMSEVEIMSEHYDKITSLQETIFQKLPEMKQFALSNVNSIDTRPALIKNFKVLGLEKLKDLAANLYLIDPEEEGFTEEFLLEVLVTQFERRISQIKRLNAMALYPTEEMIWDENLVPSDYHTSSGQILALPKLNLQFLTLHDFLLRNFELFRLESTYQIRQDIEDSCYRLRPWRAENGSILFHGWARMAQPIVRFAVVEVAKPNLGENKPYRVRADVSVNLSVKTEVKSEWESLRKHDACFLISVQPLNSDPMRYNTRGDFVSQIGLIHVRGCEIEGMLDANGRVIEEGPEPRPHITGDARTFRVILDSNQYKIDMDGIAQGKDDPYESFNIFLRRKPKENNFKAVLDTIRNLMNINCSVPDWIQDVILGYGDPGSAHYSSLPDELVELDFNDTFLDLDHVKDSFPNYEIQVQENPSAPGFVQRPFKIRFLDVEAKKAGKDEKEIIKKVLVKPYNIEKRGPYPKNVPNLNKIRFTPTQIEAVRAGMQPGLTCVVGPPGTGKTDVATQIISNIYHNFPDQRTLIVTHSNQALNQLFEKIIALDVDERHLLRLGHGEEQLETEKDFSRYGRVNFVLARRIDCLDEVDSLVKSMDVVGDQAYTCETASLFFIHHIMPRWEAFTQRIALNPTVEELVASFPFSKFFSDAPEPIFKGVRFDEDYEMAMGCWMYIKRIFQQIDEFRAFELLRTGLDRSKYLLVKEAKIIAMTCTHAALKRQELIDLAFEYDNILMEESAQILEIETFIPLLLQNPEQGRTRLKRWIMIGDHHQLPPVIKNMAFQKYGNMEQSLFARFVRLGVPTVELDAQGRSRPSISCLYKWRYKCLGDLPHVKSELEYTQALPGFKYEYQLINVEDFNGVGESEPSPYFFQNLAEAEYVVATFMYMRLLGYPADKITILTTYNGQKALIRDVINTRCGKNPLIGNPHKITTVDKYQGQQNDYILLSLVRTKTVGHLRDVRRLIVAMSRARLGLFVFARISLFSNCFELTPAFDILTQRPAKLHLYPQEEYPTTRTLDEEYGGEVLEMDAMPQMATFVYEMYQKKLSVLMVEAEKLKKEEKPMEPEARTVVKEVLGPVPIVFEETNVHEIPAEVSNMDLSESGHIHESASEALTKERRESEFM